MALRVPKAELPAELRENMIRQLGAVPEPVEVTYNNPEVAISSQEYAAKMATWDAVEASLKTFAHMAVAAQAGCSWCLDVNYFLAQNKNLDLAKGRASREVRRSAGGMTGRGRSSCRTVRSVPRAARSDTGDCVALAVAGRL